MRSRRSRWAQSRLSHCERWTPPWCSTRRWWTNKWTGWNHWCRRWYGQTSLRQGVRRDLPRSWRRINNPRPDSVCMWRSRRATWLVVWFRTVYLILRRRYFFSARGRLSRDFTSQLVPLGLRSSIGAPGPRSPSGIVPLSNLTPLRASASTSPGSVIRPRALVVVRPRHCPRSLSQLRWSSRSAYGPRVFQGPGVRLISWALH